MSTRDQSPAEASSDASLDASEDTLQSQPRPRPRPTPKKADAKKKSSLSGHVQAAFATIVVIAICLLTLTLTPNGMPDLVGQTDAQDANSQTQATETQKVDVTIKGMSFVPDRIEVVSGTKLVVNLKNTGAISHDLTSETGATTGLLAPGESGQVDLGVITGPAQAWCSVAGHKQMGMVLKVVVKDSEGSGSHDHTSAGSGQMDHASGTGSGTFNLETLLEEDHPLVDPLLAPADQATYHRVIWNMTEREEKLAGETRAIWTFNDQVPGPILRGKVGDTFEIVLNNQGTMEHGVDFHAGEVSPDDAMQTIAPGASHTYKFTATHAGIWLYHCSSHPMSAHIAHGMFGAVIIDPPDLGPVEREYMMAYSDIAMGEDAAAVDPALVAFNGYPFQYVRHPISVKVGETIRIWAINAGPNTPLSLHVVGAHLSATWKEGQYGVQPGSGIASQALDLAPAQGGFVELTFQEPGTYTLVNHVMTYGERGAKAQFKVTE